MNVLMPRDDIIVIEATEADLGPVAEFLWAAWREAGPGAAGFAGATEELVSEIANPEALRSRLGGPGGRLFIAREGSAIIGFAANRHLDPQTVELAGIVVLESRTGGGIGSRLLSLAIQMAKDDGYQEMRVRTEVENQRAQWFYVSKGFSPLKTLRQEVGDVNVEVLELSRSL